MNVITYRIGLMYYMTQVKPNIEMAREPQTHRETYLCIIITAFVLQTAFNFPVFF